MSAGLAKLRLEHCAGVFTENAFPLQRLDLVALPLARGLW
jgi:hypothetical protein